MDGKLNARAKCDFTDNFSVKTNAQVQLFQPEDIVCILWFSSCIIFSFYL